jgi:site-specific DNA-cytosine methylase
MRLVLKSVGQKERVGRSLEDPAPTVMADGIGGVCRRGWQYWVEGMTLEAANRIPREGEAVPPPVILPTGAGGPDKPPYRPLTMAEIAAIPWNGLNVISTFAGAGGSSLGYRMAGFRVLWANEFVEAAREVYRLNARAGTIIDGRDIRAVKPEEVLAATGLKAGELDVLDGSPPCAAFSTAGKRAKTWGKVRNYSDKAQKTDDLFFEFARLVSGIKPRAFVAENVSGLVKGVAKGYFLEILAALKGCGYRVEARLLDAQWLGVPQARQRMIFIGVREDLGLKPAFPAPLPYRYSVRDALPWLSSGRVVQGPEVDFRNEGRPFAADAPLPTVTAGDPDKRMPRQFYVEERVIQADRFDSLIDVADRPALTIKATIDRSSPRIEARVIHDTSGLYGAGDVTDRPCPAITVGVHSVNSLHFRVEERVVGVASRDRVYGREVRSLDEPSPTIQAGGANGMNQSQFGLTVEPEADISRFAIGKKWDEIGPGGHVFYGTGLHRPSLDGPSPTVTAVGGTSSAASVTHPTEKRKFSIAELKRICAFPDDFVLTGTYAQQWERLGRAVPPAMMFRVASALRDVLLAEGA